MQKIRLEMIVYLKKLLQSYPQLNIYLPEVNREFTNRDLCTIWENLDFDQN